MAGGGKIQATSMRNITILISGEGQGTNLLAILEGVRKREINARVDIVISDSPHAPGLAYARRYKAPFRVIDDHESLENILALGSRVDYIALAGWKKIISAEIVRSYSGKILNLHPGLIPDTPGIPVKNPDGTDGLWNRGKYANAAIKEFLHSGSTYAGSSIHFLSEKFDFGRVLGRCYEKIQSGDTIDSLYSRLKAKENQLYAAVLKQLCN